MKLHVGTSKRLLLSRSQIRSHLVVFLLFSLFFFVPSHCLTVFLTLCSTESWDEICWYSLVKHMALILTSVTKREKEKVPVQRGRFFFPCISLSKHAAIYLHPWLVSGWEQRLLLNCWLKKNKPFWKVGETLPGQKWSVSKTICILPS